MLLAQDWSFSIRHYQRKKSICRCNSRVPIRIVSHYRNQGPLCNPIDLVHCFLICSLCFFQCVHNLLFFLYCSMSQLHRHMDNTHPPPTFDRFSCTAEFIWTGLPTFGSCCNITCSNGRTLLCFSFSISLPFKRSFVLSSWLLDRLHRCHCYNRRSFYSPLERSLNHFGNRFGCR